MFPRTCNWQLTIWLVPRSLAGNDGKLQETLYNLLCSSGGGGGGGPGMKNLSWKVSEGK